MAYRHVPRLSPEEVQALPAAITTQPVWTRPKGALQRKKEGFTPHPLQNGGVCFKRP